MISCISRVFVVAQNTLLEALRQKVLLVLGLFALVCLGSSNFFLDFNFEDQIKFIKDFSFGAMSVFGLLLAVMGAGQMLQAEIQQGTIYTILSKPIRRAEFLWGKFLGLCGLILLAIILMTGLFIVILLLKEQSLVAEETSLMQGGHNPELMNEIARIHLSVRDPQLVQAWLLLVARLLLVAGLATFLSTFATSMVFTASSTLLVYLIGHMQSVARQVWFDHASGAIFWQKLIAGLLSICIPDFSVFDVMDDILAGSAIHWSYTLNILGYTAAYLLILMLLGQLVFERREW